MGRSSRGWSPCWRMCGWISGRVLGSLASSTDRSAAASHASRAPRGPVPPSPSRSAAPAQKTLRERDSTSFLPSSCSRSRMRRSYSLTVVCSAKISGARSMKHRFHSPTEFGCNPVRLVGCSRFGGHIPRSTTVTCSRPWETVAWRMDADDVSLTVREVATGEVFRDLEVTGHEGHQLGAVGSAREHAGEGNRRRVRWAAGARWRSREPTG